MVAGFFFLFIVFQLTRQLILWTALVGMIYIYLKNPKKILGFCLAAFFLFALFINNVEISDDSLVGSMINVTKAQIDSNKGGNEDIRITEYKYFFGKWSKNIVTDIIGNGMPHANSPYVSINTRLM